MGHFALKLSKMEQAVMLHELAQWERFADLFVHRHQGHLADLGRERARELHREVAQARGGTVLIRMDEVDRLVMTLLVESGTWVPSHAARSHQMQSAAYGAVQRLADKVERGFALTRALRIPIA